MLYELEKLKSELSVSSSAKHHDTLSAFSHAFCLYAL